MGLFDRLFGRPAVERADEELGTLRRSRRALHWNAEIPLRGIPDDGMAQIEMSGTDDGPDAKARRDALKLRKKWDAFLAADVPDALIEIDADAQDEAPSTPRHDRTTIFEAYTLQSVRLQTIGSGAHLEVGFLIADDENHLLTIHFDDWKPAGCSVDG